MPRAVVSVPPGKSMEVNVNWAWAEVTAAKTMNASGRSRFIGPSMGAGVRAPGILLSNPQPVNVLRTFPFAIPSVCGFFLSFDLSLGISGVRRFRESAHQLHAAAGGFFSEAEIAHYQTHQKNRNNSFHVLVSSI